MAFSSNKKNDLIKNEGSTKGLAKEEHETEIDCA